MRGGLGHFVKLENGIGISVPFVITPVSAGFPSPAADYLEQPIDLNDWLIAGKSSRFITRVMGDSMIDASIPPGAYLVVDKALVPRNGQIVVAVLDGEFVLKYFQKDMKGVQLVPANDNYEPIRITEHMEFRVWGVVTSIIINGIS